MIEAEHELLAIVNLLNAGGTVSALVGFVWLFVSGRIVVAASAHSLAQQTAQTTVQELYERGALPLPHSPTRGNRSSTGGDD